MYDNVPTISVHYTFSCFSDEKTDINNVHVHVHVPVYSDGNNARTSSIRRVLIANKQDIVTTCM